MKKRAANIGGNADRAQSYRWGFATGSSYLSRNLAPNSAAACGVFRKGGLSLSPTARVLPSLTRGSLASKLSRLRLFLSTPRTTFKAVQASEVHAV